jgi:hypothetical protein
MSQKYGFGILDPESKIRDSRSKIWGPGSRKKTYSGSWIRVQGSKMHWIPDFVSGSATLRGALKCLVCLFFFQILFVQSANRRCFNPFICHEICAKTVVRHGPDRIGLLGKPLASAASITFKSK